MSVWRSWYRLESDTFINTDLLRFLASCGVVIYHYGVHCFDVDRASMPIRLVWSNLSFLVDLFFVISGIVIHSLYADRLDNRRAYLTFLRKRVARLLPLHYATLAFFLAVFAASALLHQPVTAESYDMGCLPAQLTFTHAWGFCHGLTFNGPSWSISAEMGVYLLAPLLLAMSRNTIVALAGVAALILLSANLGDGEALHTRTYAFGVLRALPAFLIGTWIGAHRDARWLRPLAHVPLTLAFALFVLSPLLLPAPLARIGLAYLVAAIAFARDVAGRVAPGVRRTAPMGRLTYSLYMLHAPVATVLVVVLIERALHLEGAARAIAVGVAGGVVLPALSILSLHYFELPARCWLGGRREGGRNRQIALELAP